MSMTHLASAMEYWSQDSIKALFLEHEVSKLIVPDIQGDHNVTVGFEI